MIESYDICDAAIMMWLEKHPDAPPEQREKVIADLTPAGKKEAKRLGLIK